MTMPTTFATLQTATLDWANRSDLTAVAPDFVTLTEARLNDMLLLKDMETEDTLTATISANFIALPAGFVSPIKMWIVLSSERVEMHQARPAELPFHSTNGQPTLWAIDGANIRFDCPASLAYSFRFRYIKASNLSGSNTTNALLTKRPDIYLAGCLVELARYIRDAELFEMWEPKFLKATAELKAADSRRTGNVPLRSDVPGTGRKPNILYGVD